MIYEVSLFGTYFNQSIVNRWNYEGDDPPAAATGAFALASAFGGIVEGGIPESGTIMFQLHNISSSALTWNEISVQALYDPVDFYTTPFVPVVAGAQTGEAVSPVMAYGLRTSRVRTDIRRGMKRFAGVTEAHINSGGVISSALLTELNTLGGLMAATLTYDDEGNNLTFRPCILGRQQYDPETGLPSDTGSAYRKYPTLAEQLTHMATGFLWQPYTTVRTQGSRQYGHGA